MPLKVAKAASRRLEHYAKKKKTKDHAVHLVLAGLCNQLDRDNHEANQSDGEAAIHQVHSNREIFENLLCSLSIVGVNMVTINEDKDVLPIGDDVTHSNDNAGS